MTLTFIGEYDDPEQVEEVMKKVPLRSFSVKLSGYRPFKDMFFADFEENENLRDYVKRLRRQDFFTTVSGERSDEGEWNIDHEIRA